MSPTPNSPPQQTHATARKWQLGIPVVLGALVGVMAAGLVLGTRSVGHLGLPILGQLVDFRLTSQASEEVTLAQLGGKVWVADFIFTTCAGPCPRMSSKMSALQQEFSKASQFQLVSFSVNPEYDTPDVLAEYGVRYGAYPSRWIFLTGKREEIQRVAVQGFRVGSVEEPIFHSTYFTLVDDQGRIRGYYDSEDAVAIKQIRRDIRRLLATL